MKEQFNRLKGFADLYGPELCIFSEMENTARLTFSRYEYTEIRPPLLESTSLFQRGIGEETDVVQKEMFTFPDKKGRSLTLRPEATAGVLRAAIEGGLAKLGQLARLFTIGPMFRYERPQKGRMRQFHQINAECLGSESPVADAELISMLLRFLKALDLGKLELKLNSLGCRECRPGYISKLGAYLGTLASDELCSDCRRRLHLNPLRVLDCKICHEKLADAPKFRENICEACKEHFEAVLALLNEAGIRYELDDRLVRGLDYYCRTTFEVVSGEIGAQTAVAGGGRYDGLIAQLGGDDIPGVGFACGMERLGLLMKAPEVQKPDFYLLSLTAPARQAAFLLAHRLRGQGLRGSLNYSDASMKSLMRQASHSGARFCLILGPDELAAGQIGVRNMADGSQSAVSLDCVEQAITSL